jgi:hypothetical protein
MVKSTFLICLLGLTVQVFLVQCQLSKIFDNWYNPEAKLPKLPERPQYQIPNNIFRIPNYEKLMQKQEIEKWSARLYPSNRKQGNIGNAQFDRNDFNMFGLSLDKGKPKISNLGYGHEFQNGVRVYGGATLSQDKFLGKPVGGIIGVRIPLKRDLDRQIQLQQQQEINEAEFKNDIIMSE